MTEPERKKHGVGYWCCCLLLVPVLYVASTGPWTCICARCLGPPWLRHAGYRFLWPAERFLEEYTPYPQQFDWFMWWQELGRDSWIDMAVKPLPPP